MNSITKIGTKVNTPNKPLSWAGNALGIGSGASQYRAERTPGAVAVSGGVRQDTGGELKPLPVLPQTNSLPPVVEEALSPVEKYACGSLVVFTECENGEHHFVKKILCGREWCPECGEDGSQAHNRRIARWLPKCQQIGQLGYLVIEFPDRYRKLAGWAYSKRALRGVTNRIVEVLAGKRMGRRGRVGGYFKRGVLRWHWFGDKMVKWNPHANVVVDGAYIEDMGAIKGALRQALNCPDLIVHYGYVDQPGEIYHKLKYITRATFKHQEWDEHMAHELFNFRNSRWWGSWQDEPAWTLNSDIEAEAEAIAAASVLGSGICPDCGVPLKKWSRPVDSVYLVIWGAEEIGNTGYYRVPHHEFCGYELSPQAILRLEELERVAGDKPSVDIKHIAARKACNRWWVDEV